MTTALSAQLQQLNIKIANKLQQRTLQPVTYSVFRQTLNSAAGQKIKHKAYTTVVYDSNNHPLALLKSATIDAFGRSQPTQYFARASV